MLLEPTIHGFEATVCTALVVSACYQSVSSKTVYGIENTLIVSGNDHIRESRTLCYMLIYMLDDRFAGK
jgi:hypothetical protein